MSPLGKHYEFPGTVKNSKYRVIIYACVLNN